MAETTNHTSTVFNKILIPVITTVLGATAIYFLGFNKKSGRSDMEQMLLSKEITVKAWKSFVSSQNAGYKAVKSLEKEFTKKLMDEAANGFDGLKPILRDYEDQLFREGDKADKDIENILEEEDIDKDFVSMLNRTLDNSADTKKRLRSFFDKMISIINSGKSTQEKAADWQKEANKFTEMFEGIEERSALEAEEIAKTLAKRYSEAFDLNDLDYYVDFKKEQKDPKKEDDKTVDDNEQVQENRPAPTDPNSPAGPRSEYVNNNDPNRTNTNTNTYRDEVTATDIYGKWSMSGGRLDLYSDMSLYWTFGTRGYTTGTWKVANNQVHMTTKNPDTQQIFQLTYNITISGNSLTLTNPLNPSEVYYLTRQ